MSVTLSSAAPGGIRAVSYHRGHRHARVYLGAEVRAEPLSDEEWGEIPIEAADEAPSFPGADFCGWYRLPRIGLAAVYSAVERAAS